MNIFQKLKRWLSRRKAKGNQAPAYVSTGHKNPRGLRREKYAHDFVLWIATPFSPIVVNFKDPIYQHYKR